MKEQALQQAAAQDAMKVETWQHEEHLASGDNVSVQQAIDSTEGRLSIFWKLITWWPNQHDRAALQIICHSLPHDMPSSELLSEGENKCAACRRVGLSGGCAIPWAHKSNIRVQ